MAGSTLDRRQIQGKPIQGALDRIESLLAYVEIVGGGGQLGVPQKPLKRYHIDPRFQAMGRVAVPQTMDSAEFGQS
jgi:hypothetical protein